MGLPHLRQPHALSTATDVPVPLSRNAEATRVAVVRTLATTGALPSSDAMAERLGLTSDAYAAALAELADAHHVVLRDGAVEMAHPFATRSFGFSVMGPDVLWWGGCAWDAFAIPNLVPDARSVLVATTCPACGTPHAWTVTDAGPPEGAQVAHFATPVDRIWPGAAHACERQSIFCDEVCVDRRLADTGTPRGAVLTLAALWRLAAHWYDGRLDSPYERREPALAAEYFRSVGLRGAFWGLPDA